MRNEHRMVEFGRLPPHWHPYHIGAWREMTFRGFLSRAVWPQYSDKDYGTCSIKRREMNGERLFFAIVYILLRGLLVVVRIWCDGIVGWVVKSYGGREAIAKSVYIIYSYYSGVLIRYGLWIYMYLGNKSLTFNLYIPYSQIPPNEQCQIRAIMTTETMKPFSLS